VAAALAAGSVLALAACGADRTGESTVDLLKVPAAAASSTSPAAPVTCDDRLQSYAPRASAASDPYVSAIKNRKRLVAGVSADTLKLGARNPLTNDVEGFDIDMVKAVAKAIFGNEKSVEYRVITAGQRISALTTPVDKGGVDIVARAMTMTCSRWKDIAFSSQYYQAGQKLLVGTDSKVIDLDGLKRARQRVCVQRGTTTLDNVQKAVGEDLVFPAATATDCLVAFQQGAVQAIASDDTILAGLAAQDPYAEVVGTAVTEEPYGLGLPKGEKGFARYVNGVLEDVRRDGRWKASYDHWLAAELGPAPSPPKPLYGRA
jgi:polar amino acid transport system substrate-binding protein